MSINFEVLLPMLKQCVAAVIGLWMFIISKKELYEKLAKIAEPLILIAEQYAQDGIIDKADRKALVMKAVQLLEADGTIRLNWLSRYLLSKVVDKIAGKLPDFQVQKNAETILAAVVKRKTRENNN